MMYTGNFLIGPISKIIDARSISGDGTEILDSLLIDIFPKLVLDLIVTFMKILDIFREGGILGNSNDKEKDNQKHNIHIIVISMGDDRYRLSKR